MSVLVRVSVSGIPQALLMAPKKKSYKNRAVAPQPPPPPSPLPLNGNESRFSGANCYIDDKIIVKQNSRQQQQQHHCGAQYKCVRQDNKQKS